jgi:hypothetical protein
VLYELLTGRLAFSGESVTDTIAEIIKSDPEWSLLPVDTPKSIHTLIQRCLKKDVKQRLQATGEARIVIEEVLEGKDRADSGENENTKALTAAAGNTRHSVVAWIGGIFLGALLAAAFFGGLRDPIPRPQQCISVQSPVLPACRRSRRFRPTGVPSPWSLTATGTTTSTSVWCMAANWCKSLTAQA